MNKNILIVDDEEIVRKSLAYALGEKGFRVTTASSGAEALERLREEENDLVIADLKMPGMDGIELTKAIKNLNADLPVIIITAHGTINTAVEAIKYGAYDYITKPFDSGHLLITIEHCFEKSRLTRELKQLREEIKRKYSFENIIGTSKKMEEVFEIVRRVAESNATVLIHGESGTGKELFGRAIHYNSLRSKNPFLAITCGGLPESLLETELFGYVKGAFTGAVTDRTGLFEEADGGTIFLDEVDSMSRKLQAALLRVIQEKEIRKVGGAAVQPIDVRIVAASIKDLEKMVHDGTFREDLYFRLNVVRLKLPSLRERKEDIPQLATHFLKKAAQENNKDVRDFSHQAMQKLLHYNWPGNVRELENKIMQAVVMCRGERINADDLYISHGGKSDGEKEFQAFKQAKRKIVGIFEKDYISEALRLTSGNVTEASKISGMERSGFQKIMQKHNMLSSEFRK